MWSCAKRVYGEEVAETALDAGLVGLRAVPEFARARTWLVEGASALRRQGDGHRRRRHHRMPSSISFGRSAPRSPSCGAPGTGAGRGPYARRRPLAGGLVGADLVWWRWRSRRDPGRSSAPRTLAAMEPHAWLVNVAHGRHVVTDDLVDALRRRRHRRRRPRRHRPRAASRRPSAVGAAQRVITPHSANTPELPRGPLGPTGDRERPAVCAGEPLLGFVDPRTGY